MNKDDLVKRLESAKCREYGDLIWLEAAWTIGSPDHRARAWQIGADMKRLAYSIADEIDRESQKAAHRRKK
mgnify:CR=1 FL=1